MTDSIYNNAGMPSGQGAAPEVPEDLRGTYQAMQMHSERDVIHVRPRVITEFIDRIAALTLERDTLEAEIKEWKHSLESVALMAGMGASESWGTLDILTHVREMREANAALKAERDAAKDALDDYQGRLWCALGQPVNVELVAAVKAMREENAALKAEVERLSAPVSDEEWTNVVVVSPQHDHRTWMERKQVNSIIAARASTPPPHPINDDEQRRKDAGWNDRPKARCICGEMIAWYSGEWLHVAGRSGSCADGRLASPAHFLVGRAPRHWAYESH